MGNHLRKIKKHRIFEYHAEHLELLKRKYRIKLYGQKTEGYICPLCNKIFDKDAFDEKYTDQLTLEHVPPGKLGGSVELLTCKICNNTHGAKLESVLKENLETNDFFSRIPGSNVNARFLIDDKWNIGGKFINTEDGFRISAIKENSHHNHYDKLFSGDVDTINKFDVSFTYSRNKRKASLALLRTGFLMMYSRFGYPVLINKNMINVRDQINNPDKDILENVGTIELDYEEEFEGINFVREPEELKSFAVLFRTKTENKVRKHAVLFPGPSSPGLNIYKNLKSLSGSKGEVNLKLTKLNVEDSLLKSHRILSYYLFWNSFKN